MLRLAFQVLLSTALATTPFVAARSGCKCTSSDACWPSKSTWATLSAKLTRPVFDVRQPGYYCHDPNYDEGLCAYALANHQDIMWIADQPGAAQEDNVQFNATSWCYVNDTRTNPCGQGRVPSVGVNATTVQDVQATLAFAAQYNLKLHVKNSGHDFLGRGLGPGSLMIWTHYWKGATYTASYTYVGGQSAGVPAITVSPGTQWVEAYQLASDNGVTIAGGIGPNASVGAGGGWPMGGGHNILSPVLDLGADNVLEVSVVLPNATHVTANPYQNTDLFWAIRGGGGPSFGIATSITYKVYPQFPVYAAFFEATTRDTDAYVDLLNSFHAALPSLGEAGWSGYYPFSPSYLALMYLLPNGTTKSANDSLGAWISRAARIPGVTIKTNASALYTSFEDWLVSNILDPVDVVGFDYDGATALGIGATPASWLLPVDVFSNKTASDQLSRAMAKMSGGIGQHVGGGVVWSHPGDYNAIHPAWRNTLVDFVTFVEWQDGVSPADVQGLQQNLSASLAPVRALTPDNPAQYLNEPDILAIDFTQANWGSNYPRLLSIKKAIDPDNMLLVLQGVNSENWDAEQICPLWTGVASELAGWFCAYFGVVCQLVSWIKALLRSIVTLIVGAAAVLVWVLRGDGFPRVKAVCYEQCRKARVAIDGASKRGWWSDEKKKDSK